MCYKEKATLAKLKAKVAKEKKVFIENLQMLAIQKLIIKRKQE